MPSSTSFSPRPGGTRQSTFSSARLGITLTFSEALMRVGVNVTPIIGSKKIPSIGFSAFSRSRAPLGSSGSSPIALRKAAGSPVAV